MRIIAVVSSILIVASVSLGESLDELSRSDGVKKSSGAPGPAIDVLGRPKSTRDVNFGYNPVKTSRRRNVIPQTNNSPANREASIQAYGLPKRASDSALDNGRIERVNLDRVTGLDGKVDKVNVHHKSGIQAYGMPKRNQEDNGFIESIGADSDLKEKSGAVISSYPKALESPNVRSVRSVDDFDHDVGNDLTDLEAQEAKVFRPLFVYRQQVADRYRLNPKKNPIYGAYQYGNNRRKNGIHYGPSKYYY